MAAISNESDLEPIEAELGTFVDDDYIPEWLWDEVDCQVDNRSSHDLDTSNQGRFQKLVSIINSK